MPARRLPSGLYYLPIKDGKKGYFIDFKRGKAADGRSKRHYFWLGDVDVEYAIKFLAEFRDKVLRQAAGLATEVRVEIPTFQQVAERYVSEIAAQNGDVKTARSNLQRLYKSIGAKPINEVTDNDLKRIRQEMLNGVSSATKKPFTPRTIRNSLKTAVSVFNLAKGEGWITANPAIRASKDLKSTPRDVEIWHPRRDVELIRALDDHAAVAAVILGLDCGFRIKTIVSLKVDDVEFLFDEHGDELVRICVRVLKGGKVPEYRECYSERLVSVLRRQVAEARARNSVWLFYGQNPSKRMEEKYISRRLVIAAKKAFKRHVTPHHLRYNFQNRTESWISNRNLAKALTSHESDSAQETYNRLRTRSGVELYRDTMKQFAKTLKEQGGVVN